MSDEVDAVLDGVREQVTPSEDERAELQAVAGRLIERAEDAVAELPVEGRVVQVGSTARGTWTAGDRDVDLFVCFPPEIDREDLETYGLAVGHAVLPEGHEEYAEHPYVKGTVDGYDVDLVPCYDVGDAAAIQSAVDRTPFHTAWLDGRIDDLTADVRVAKQFLSAVGAYGSDLKTRGFSGYLTELLVLEYGGFRGLCEAAAGEWHPPVHIDPASHGRVSFEDPLVVIDPTDPERNVAAVCSARAVARLVHYARDLLADPRVGVFDPREPEPLDADAVREAVRERGTHPVAVRFETPAVVEDQLYPQLDKSLSGLRNGLERNGFAPLRSDRFARRAPDPDGGATVLLVECSVPELPAVERHEGPPVAVRNHAEGFYDKYADDPEVYGPFLDGWRYVAEREREIRTPEAFARASIWGVSLGPDVERALRDGYEVLAGEAIAALADPFGPELAAYFEPVP